MELPLLYEIEQSGGSAEPKHLYNRVAKHFPLLTDEDRKLVTKTRANRFTNRVQFARNVLCKRGELDGSVYGVWKITDKGKKRLAEEWPEKFRTESLGPGETDRYERQKHDSQIRVPGSDPIVPELKHRLLAQVHALAPKQFEQLVKQFLRAHGLEQVEVTGTHNGGIVGHGVVSLVEVRVGFQARQCTASQSVGTQIVQLFKESLAYTVNERGVFITTSDFSLGAVSVAKRSGVPVVLVNGQLLASLMVKKGMGVKPVPGAGREIDEQFFRNLG